MTFNVFIEQHDFGFIPFVTSPRMKAKEYLIAYLQHVRDVTGVYSDKHDIVYEVRSGAIPEDYIPAVAYLLVLKKRSAVVDALSVLQASEKFCDIAKCLAKLNEVDLLLRTLYEMVLSDGELPIIEGIELLAHKALVSTLVAPIVYKQDYTQEDIGWFISRCNVLGQYAAISVYDDISKYVYPKGVIHKCRKEGIDFMALYTKLVQ